LFLEKLIRLVERWRAQGQASHPLPAAAHERA